MSRTIIVACVLLLMAAAAAYFSLRRDRRQAAEYADRHSIEEEPMTEPLNVSEEAEKEEHLPIVPQTIKVEFGSIFWPIVAAWAFCGVISAGLWFLLH